MNLAHRIKRSVFANTIGLTQPIERTANSYIYMRINSNVCQIITTDSSKMLYYIYAKEKNFKHIPKVYALVYDHINGICFIEREILHPVTKTRKLNEIEKTKLYLEQRNSGNRLTNELLSFYYDKHIDNNIDFDFGPHWIMETCHGKLVVSDAFQSKRRNILPRF